MSEEPPAQHPSWLERLSHLLTREPQDREQLIQLLRDAVARELLNAEALTMIEGVLQVSEMQARDIMIPRAQMTVVEEDATPSDFLPTIINSAHSRFPVIGENRDEVVGILLAKDLLRFTFNGDKQQFKMRDVLRPPVFIPESKRLDVLLREFRLNRNHMAIVADEYGGVAGLVTIEDVLEQIVGEIEDEYDVEEETNIKKISEKQFIVKALTPIEDFNEFFATKLSDEEFDTIGGLVMQQFGRLPQRGETVNMEDFRCKILHADNRRIRLMRITLIKEKTA